MYRCIYLWFFSAPVLNHIASKNVRLVKLSYNDITATCLAKQWWPCSDENYHKRTWYTQIFLCQLLRGRNKNQFFHYVGLFHDLLHRQDLLNKWFERKLKLLVMFFAIFGKRFLPGCFRIDQELNHHFTFKKAWEGFCRNFNSYIKKSFEPAVINIL